MLKARLCQFYGYNQKLQILCFQSLFQPNMLLIYTQQIIMKLIPQILRNQRDNSITLTHSTAHCSVIWLHGLGGVAESYIPFWKHKDSALYQGTRVKLIQAPERWVTVNQSPTYSWYDLRSLNRFTEPVDQVFDLDQVQQTHQTIDNYVKQQLQFWSQQGREGGLPPQRRIYVGGMSQGGVMALHYGLSSPFTLGGVLSLSGYLLPVTKLRNLGKTPVLLVHGSRDNVIWQWQAKDSYSSLLKGAGMVDYHSISGLQHSVCLQQIELIAKWMKISHSLHQINH